MSSGHGFDFFGFEWWYSFNKKTFRSFTLERKKKVRIFFFKKKKKKRKSKGRFFSVFRNRRTWTFEWPWKDESLLPLETRILATGRDLFSWIVRPPSWIRFRGPQLLFRTVPICFRVDVMSVYYVRFRMFTRKDFDWKKAKVNHLIVKWKVKINFYLVVPG